MISILETRPDHHLDQKIFTLLKSWKDGPAVKTLLSLSFTVICLIPFFSLYSLFFFKNHINKEFATAIRLQIQYRLIIYQKNLSEQVQLPALTVKPTPRRLSRN